MALDFKKIDFFKSNGWLKVDSFLTEKEVNIIIFLSTSKTPITINELQSKVWGHHIQLETHTVETHIYRLRKKILEVFNDNDFILSHKNGYRIIK